MNKTVLLMVTALAAFSLLLIPAAIIKQKYHKSLFPVFAGALTFFVFANVLESMLHYICLISDNQISRYLSGNVVAYALYGCLAAGIFEETGRFVAFRSLLKKYEERETAFSYGIGHGGMEAILTVGANYLVLAVASLAIGTSSEGQYTAVLPALAGITPGICAIALLERISAMIFHISASVIVFTAARERKRIWYYPLAILLHALLDVPALLFQRGMLPLLVVEAIVILFSVNLGAFALKLYKSL